MVPFITCKVQITLDWKRVRGVGGRKEARREGRQAERQGQGVSSIINGNMFAQGEAKSHAAVTAKEDAERRRGLRGGGGGGGRKALAVGPQVRADSTQGDFLCRLATSAKSNPIPCHAGACLPVNVKHAPFLLPPCSLASIHPRERD